MSNEISFFFRRLAQQSNSEHIIRFFRNQMNIYQRDFVESQIEKKKHFIRFFHFLKNRISRET